MSNKDDITRILWISDIHYQKYPAQAQELVEDYINKFIKQIKEIHDNKSIDYILLSGDIAFDGSKESYDHFKSEVLDRLIKEAFKAASKPKVVIVPGNHDLNWEGSDKLMKLFINSWDGMKTDRNDFLKRYVEDFRGLFKQYTEAFTSGLSKEHRSMFNVSQYSSQKTPNEYNVSRLFGYVLDKEKKILFVLLNTSWYSLGTTFDDTLRKVLKAKTTYDKDITELLITHKNQFYEYGGQIIGRLMLEEVDLARLMTGYSDLTVILCMHHPMSWLEWGEINSESQDGLQLPKMIKNADILLTGHEHLPVTAPVSTIDGNTLHFAGGRFLQDRMIQGKSSLEHNRFSVLDIGKKYVRPSVQEARYVFTNSQWGLHSLGNKIALKQEGRKFRREELDKHIPKFQLEKYIVKEVLHHKEFSPKVIVKVDVKDVPIILYRGLKGLNDRVFISLLESPSPELLFDLFGKQPLELYRLCNCVPAVCTFISLDYKFDPKLDLQKQYEARAIDWNTMLKGFIRNAERVYDQFRMNHFNGIDELYLRGNKDWPGELANILQTRFVNHVISYWALESQS